MFNTCSAALEPTQKETRKCRFLFYFTKKYADGIINLIHHCANRGQSCIDYVLVACNSRQALSRTTLRSCSMKPKLLINMRGYRIIKATKKASSDDL